MRSSGGAPRLDARALSPDRRREGRIGDAVDREFLRNDDDVREYNVTRCSYAEFFKALGEPELGAILLCDVDFHIAEVGGPAVTFTRTQTIMKGAAYCDFRYRFKRG